MKAAITLGYGRNVEVRPGIWKDEVIEVEKLADVIQRTESFRGEGNVIPEYKSSTGLSVISSGPIQVDYSALRYVLYGGVRWAIASAVSEPPRLNIFLGEVYNGPIPGGTPGGP